MNTVIIAGRILNNTDKAPNMYKYFEGNGEKKSVLIFHLSVTRDGAKKDENGYYPSDIFQCKIFGANADYVNKYYGPGNGIVVTGFLGVDQGGLKEDGTHYPSRTVIYVNRVEKVPVINYQEQNGNSSTVSATVPTPKTPTAFPKAAAPQRKPVFPGMRNANKVFY